MHESRDLRPDIAVPEYARKQMHAALEGVPTHVRQVVEHIWHFVSADPELTDEERGHVVQGLISYVTNVVYFPEALPPRDGDDIIDTTEALEIAGYTSGGSLVDAINDGRLPLYRQRVSPAGRVFRFFLRSDVERFRDMRDGRHKTE